MDIEKQKCEVCDKECWVLYPIVFGKDHFMTPRRGVCKECFNKAEDLDAILLKKSKKVIAKSIQEKKESIAWLQEELDKLLKIEKDCEGVENDGSCRFCIKI